MSSPSIVIDSEESHVGCSFANMMTGCEKSLRGKHSGDNNQVMIRLSCAQSKEEIIDSDSRSNL